MRVKNEKERKELAENLRKKANKIKIKLCNNYSKLNIFT